MSAFDRMQASGIVQGQMADITAHARTVEPFVVNNFTYSAEQLVALLAIDPGNLDVQMAQVAAWIGHWGMLSASAKRAHDRFEASYRSKREGFVLSAVAEPEAPAEDVEGDLPVPARGKKRAKATPKRVSKTAAESEWRTTPEYEALYSRLADLAYAWSCAEFVYEALLRKANMLTALGKLYADERSAPPPGGAR